MKYINLKNMKRKIIGKQNNMILNKIKNEVISFLKESTKNPKILLKKICKYGLIIALFFCIIMTGVHGHLIIVKNQEKSNLEGELGEINIFRAQLEDIAIKSSTVISIEYISPFIQSSSSKIVYSAPFEFVTHSTVRIGLGISDVSKFKYTSILVASWSTQFA